MRHNWSGPAPGLTARDHPRVTRVGRVLRSLRLNEFPQLINVLFGDMGVVGPRPEDPAYVAHYTPEQREVLSVCPGILGPGQKAFRNESADADARDLEGSYVRPILPRKLAIDLEYVRHKSIVGDLKIILATFADLGVESLGTRLSIRGRHLFVLDALSACLAYVLSFAIRFDSERLPDQIVLYWFLVLLFLAVRMPVYFYFGLYKRVWALRQHQRAGRRLLPRSPREPYLWPYCCSSVARRAA